ncbi:hypothetical protein HK099_000386 [Clydaea vesicula]|uniref:DUF4442 domain-containing protein n=1 Tax=Clydaea vesicula TaxID=447962 RepID=A0AAD5U5V8_9FUNG|nr:hypothetical protein HK099_000386 [Clydaea vesicula]KAJ3388984.1 hypothetical protein HDU92_001223 [Lobulomyces angularis]
MPPPIQYWFDTLTAIPIVGQWLFRMVIKYVSPYTVSMKNIKIRTGYCVAEIEEQTSLKNPFNSIHAAALINLGEATGGFCVLTMCQKNAEFKGIVKSIHADYFKKSKGIITSTSRIEENTPLLKDGVEEGNILVTSELKDKFGDVTCNVKVEWTIRRIKEKKDL